MDKIKLMNARLRKAALPFLNAFNFYLSVAIILILASSILIYKSDLILDKGWFISDEDKIKGVWITEGDLMFFPQVSTNRFLDSFYKSRKNVELTFHENGQVTSSGRACRRYSFTGKSTISYRSDRDILDPKFYSVGFPTKNEMIWYIDSKKKIFLQEG